MKPFPVLSIFLKMLMAIYWDFGSAIGGGGNFYECLLVVEFILEDRPGVVVLSTSCSALRMNSSKSTSVMNVV